MYHYLDTSFLAPYLIPEPTSHTVENILMTLPVDSLLISQWTQTEFASLLARQVRMGVMHQQIANRVFEKCDQIIREGMLRVVSIEGNDYQQATSWLLNGMVPLRGPDALHLGIVYRLGTTGTTTLWTLDRKMADAARFLGLKVGEFTVTKT